MVLLAGGGGAEAASLDEVGEKGHNTIGGISRVT